MNIGIVGSGEVAKSLAEGFLKYRHVVTMGTRDPARLEEWARPHGEVRIGSFADAIAHGDVSVLAVKGAAAAAALRAVDANVLQGKILIDATNPIAETPPVDGVFSVFTGPNESLMEQLQAEFPATRFVKAFNSVGHEYMVDPKFQGGKPSMFICGNDPRAKGTVKEILDQFGWEIIDMGGARSARAIEPLAVLWCIRGFVTDEWDHAFKLLTR